MLPWWARVDPVEAVAPTIAMFESDKCIHLHEPKRVIRLRLDIHVNHIQRRAVVARRAAPGAAEQIEETRFMSSSVAPTPPDPSAPRAPQEDGCNAWQEGRHEPSTQAVGVRPSRLPPNAADSQQALHSVSPANPAFTGY